MTSQALEAWLQAGMLLYSFGGVALAKIKDAIHAAHPEATEAQLNALLEAIKEDATRRKALADADAGNAPAPAA